MQTRYETTWCGENFVLFVIFWPLAEFVSGRHFCFLRLFWNHIFTWLMEIKIEIVTLTFAYPFKFLNKIRLLRQFLTFFLDVSQLTP